MALISPYLSVTAINVTGLNSPVKRDRVAGWKKSNNSIQLYAAYKRFTLALRAHMGSK